MVYRKQVEPWFFPILVSLIILLRRIQLNEFERRSTLRRWNLNELIRLNVVAKQSIDENQFQFGFLLLNEKLIVDFDRVVQELFD